VLAACVPAAAVVPVAVLRFLDGDEGDYAAAAGLVADGELLYHDFLYTQTPLLPYVYGLWGLVTGETWLGLRALSALLTIALAVAVFAHVRRRLGTGWALVAVVLLSGSTLFFTWFPTIKTYALSTLLLFVAYALLAREGPVTARATVAAGALAALSVQTRSLLLGGAVVLAWAAWREGTLARYAGGFLLGSLPSVAYLLYDPDNYLFGNLWYHGARSEGGLVGDLEQKAKVVANLLGIATESSPLPQYLLLTVAAVAAAVTFRAAKRRVSLALLVALGLAVVALLPTPTYTQYFATTIPFVIVGVVELAAYARASVDSVLVRAIAAAACGVYLLIAPVELGRLVSRSADNRPSAVQEVNDEVASRTDDGDLVVASWAGYAYGTGAVQLPGLENAFAPHEAAAISRDDERRYHVASVGDVEDAIRSGRPRLVVVKIWHDLPPIPDFDAASEDAGYRVAAEVSGARIYESR
jgi:hypothetical protein